MPTSDLMVPVFEISIAGSKIPDSLQVLSIDVQQSLELIDMFTIVFENDVDGTIGDSTMFTAGNAVEIKLGYMGALATVAKGEIVSLEPSWLGSETPTVTVRGYDRAHRLRRGRKTRVFKQVKASDVVSTLASEEGLSASCDATPVTHDWLLQNNQTNIDFIMELARRHFYEVNVSVGELTLTFKKPKSDQAHAIELEWGKDLKSFYIRESLANVPTAVTSTGWDQKQKKAILSSTPSVHATLGPKAGPAAVKSVFGDAALQVALRPVSPSGDADTLAFAALNERVNDVARGHGTCMGDTAIKPGIVLSLKGLGTGWAGDYYVVGANHAVHAKAGYVTEFIVRRTGV